MNENIDFNYVCKEDNHLIEFPDINSKVLLRVSNGRNEMHIICDKEHYGESARRIKILINSGIRPH